MHIADAQRENRVRFGGGFYGQAVSAALWLASAPVAQFRLNLFYPALMILLGAHYVPFVFLYGMRMFAALAAALVAGGVVITMYLSRSFSIGAWYTGVTLLLFAVAGRMIVSREKASPISPSRI
jgi:hypothetical protein